MDEFETQRWHEEDLMTDGLDVGVKQRRNKKSLLFLLRPVSDKNFISGS